MKRFVEGEDRRQGALLPHCLDDYVTENNPVRVIEAFIDELDLATLGDRSIGSPKKLRPTVGRRRESGRPRSVGRAGWDLRQPDRPGSGARPGRSHLRGFGRQRVKNITRGPNFSTPRRTVSY